MTNQHSDESSPVSGGRSSYATQMPSAPASVLLLGEYAVLEVGGLGVAVSPEVRVVSRANPLGRLVDESSGNARPQQIIGRFPHGSDNWPGRGFLDRVCTFLESKYGAPRFSGEIVIDSSALFNADGKKRGFGSSAAVTVVATSLWLQETDHDLLIEAAVEAHRHAQGGRGSGYDVACSTFGSIIRFCGGPLPQAALANLPWLPELTVFAGPKPVGTPSAISSYHRWKADNPDRASEFLMQSNELVEAFLSAEEWPAAQQTIAKYRELTIGLGDLIGVESRIDPPGELAEGEWKAIGAGNELGVILCERGRIDTDVGTAVEISQEGVRWQ